MRVEAHPDATQDSTGYSVSLYPSLAEQEATLAALGMTPEAQQALREAAMRWNLQPPCQVCRDPIIPGDGGAPKNSVVLVHAKCCKRFA